MNGDGCSREEIHTAIPHWTKETIQVNSYTKLKHSIVSRYNSVMATMLVNEVYVPAVLFDGGSKGVCIQRERRQVNLCLGLNKAS
jgi:hypothetical protein